MSQIKLTKKQRLELRNERIRKRFTFLTSKKHLNTEYTLSQLADEFLELTEDTIWLIVSQTGFYKSK